MVFKSVEEFLLENSSGTGEPGKLSASRKNEKEPLPRSAPGGQHLKNGERDYTRIFDSGTQGPVDDDAAVRGKNIVLRELAGGSKTRYQLSRRLEREGIGHEAAEAVLNRCEELKLIDDREYAMQWVKTRSKRRSLGKSILRRELEEKRVKRSYIDEALRYCGLDDEDLARYLVDKKLASVNVGGLDFRTREKYRRRLFGLLRRKGIASEISIMVINQKIASLE